jgi:hypothetical protein
VVVVRVEIGRIQTPLYHVPPHPRLEVVPAPPGAATVAKVGAPPHLDVQLVQVGGLVLGGFATEGTFPQYHMGVGVSGLLGVGDPVRLAIL